jgi:energy-coupling factor transporter ATP-binding protein EcfA2
MRIWASSRAPGWLFRGLDLFIGPRDRLALIGRNGAGKTTLLKCLAGVIDTDEGRRTIQPGVKVILLEQDPQVAAFETLRDFALHGADAPPAHEVDSIASQIGIDLDRPAAYGIGGRRAPRAASPVRLRRIRRCCCSTSRPTISISPPSSGWRIGSAAIPAPSSRSATTARS